MKLTRFLLLDAPDHPVCFEADPSKEFLQQLSSLLDWNCLVSTGLKLPGKVGKQD